MEKVRSSRTEPCGTLTVRGLGDMKQWSEGRKETGKVMSWKPNGNSLREQSIVSTAADRLNKGRTKN